MNQVPTGFPRPRVTREGFEGMPTPWVSDGPHSPGTIDLNRAEDSIALMLCVVCGLGFQADERAHVAATELCSECSEPWADGESQCEACGSAEKTLGVMYDHGLTHERCAVMTVSFCPSFRPSESTPPEMTMWSISIFEAERIMHKMGSAPIHKKVHLSDHLDEGSEQIQGSVR